MTKHKGSAHMLSETLPPVYIPPPPVSLTHLAHRIPIPCPPLCIDRAQRSFLPRDAEAAHALHDARAGAHFRIDACRRWFVVIVKGWCR